MFWLLVRRMISDAACDFLIQPLANDGRGRLQRENRRTSNTTEASAAGKRESLSAS